MKIGEEDLVRPHERVFRGLRLLYFDDHLTARPDFFSAVDYFGTSAPIVVVGETDGERHTGFDDHRMPVMGNLTHAGRRHADPDVPGP